MWVQQIWIRNLQVQCVKYDSLGVPNVVVPPANPCGSKSDNSEEARWLECSAMTHHAPVDKS